MNRRSLGVGALSYKEIEARQEKEREARLQIRRAKRQQRTETQSAGMTTPESNPGLTQAPAAPGGNQVAAPAANPELAQVNPVPPVVPMPDGQIAAMLQMMMNMQQQQAETLRVLVNLTAGQGVPAATTVSTPTPVVVQSEQSAIRVPEKFSGKEKEKMTPNAWLYLMENYFEARAKDSDKERLLVIPSSLSGDAINWWISVEHKIQTWEEFRRAFLGRYLSLDDEDEAIRELESLKQGNKTVSEYADKFDQLCNRISDLSEPEKYRKFYQGLWSDLQREVDRKQIPKEERTYANLRALARSFESFTRRPGRDPIKNQDRRDDKKGHRRQSFLERSREAAAKKEMHPSKSGSCNLCGEEGHWARSCPKRAVPKSPTASTSTTSTSSTSTSSASSTVSSAKGKAVRVISSNQDDSDEEAKMRQIFSSVKKMENPKTRISEFAVQGWIGKTAVKVVVDSACHDTCMSVNVAKKLNLQIDWEKPTEHFILADQVTKIPVYGRHCLRLDMGGYCQSMDFSVAGIDDDVILGVDWIGQFKKGELTFDGPTGRVFVKKKEEILLPPYQDKPAIEMVSSKKFARILRKDTGESEYFLLMCRKVSAPKSTRVASEPPAWNSKANWIMEEYGDRFPDKLPPGLPPARPTDLKIELLPGAPEVYRRQYRLSPPEAAELQRQADVHKEGGRVQSSTSPFNAPSLMERKIGTNELRWCVDYRGLNLWTKADPYPMPIAEQLIEKMHGAVVISKIDFLHGYFQSRMHPDSVHLTAFSTEEEHLEFLVMPLGLKNAPASFMRLMHHIFKPLLGVCVVIFLDDIAVFSKSEEEHRIHLTQVFNLMREHQIYASKKKCFFYLDEIPFLGYIVGKNGVRTDPSIIATVKEFEVPRNQRTVRMFLGLVGFYRKFIPGFAGKAQALHELLKSDKVFIWTPECQSDFERLKAAVTASPVLILPDFTKEFIVTTDAGNGTIAGVLQQDHGRGIQPIRYYSRKMNSAEVNYGTSEQELLAVIATIRAFDHYLFGRRFILETDHKALVYVFTQPKLSPRQCRWLNTISGFDFEIKHLEGRRNVVADGLTRIDRVEDVKAKETQPHKVRSIISSSVDLMESIAHASYSKEEEDRYLDGGQFYKRGSIYFKMANNEYANDRVCVPSGSEAIKLVLESLHDEPMSGHLGIEKTLQSVRQRFFWKGMKADVNDFVASCVVCQKVKPSKKKTPGLLKPISVPEIPWTVINTDFVTGLPKTKDGHDAITTWIDRTTKMLHIQACHKDDDAVTVVTDYLNNVVKLHGLQKEIISDRDPRFTAQFHQELMKRLRTKRSLSTSYHPQTDGLAEEVNGMVKTMLMAFCEGNKDNWDEFLGLLEFAYNSSVHSATRQTPFFLNYGREPLRPVDLEILEGSNRKIDSVEKVSTAITKALEASKDAIAKAQLRMQKYANKHRRDLQFSAGDRVLLSAADIQLPPTLGSYKLNEKYLGPFKIIEKVSDVNYKLELPVLMGIHPVFHVSKLKEFKESNPKFGERSAGPFNDLSEVIAPDGDKDWEIEAILEDGKEQDGDRNIYLCKWRGWDSVDNTWEVAANIKKYGGGQLLREYIAAKRQAAKVGAKLVVKKHQGHRGR